MGRGGLCAAHPAYHGGDLRSHGRGAEDGEKMGGAGRAHRRRGRRAPETLQRGDGYAPGVEVYAGSFKGKNISLIKIILFR